MNYLTIGTLWKNEYDYAWDFIKYHRGIGVDKFTIFDREYNQLYNMLGKEPDIEIIHFPDVPGNIHQEAWGQLIKFHQNKTKWLALIDADQALVPVKDNNIKNILQDYEDFASIQINWKTFGSSFHEKKLSGSLYERFLLCAKQNCVYNFHTQFICQPNRTLGIKTEEPHYPLLPMGEISVNTDKQEIDQNKVVELNPNTPRSFNVPALHNVLYAAHYTNKSKEEFLLKNNKGRADIFGAKMPLLQFEEYDTVCNEEKEERIVELWKSFIK